MPDIFLSYSRDDQAVARRVAEAFEREGFSVWWDATLRSGEAYDQVTERALKTAKAVVVLWSTRSVESRWVRAEATLADRNKTLVPAMIEPCDRPIMFELTQTADLSHWHGDASDPAWRAYVSDVRGFVERNRPRTAAVQTPAIASPGTSPVPASPAFEQGGEPNLVVLPIASRSGLPEDELFAEDLTSEIMAELS
ncbi:MAG: TIR domain-containing protein [Steroidobacteraceae bacterium]